MSARTGGRPGFARSRKNFVRLRQVELHVVSIKAAALGSTQLALSVVTAPAGRAIVTVIGAR